MIVQEHGVNGQTPSVLDTGFGLNNFFFKFGKQTWNLSKKIYKAQFSGERILHTENVYIESIFASNEQWKCIIISNLALFLLKLNKMCKFFKSYEESLHLGACKPVKYVRNYVVFWKNLHSWQKFYTTAGRGGRDKFQVCVM